MESGGTVTDSEPSAPLVVPDGTRHYAEEHGVENPVYVYIPNARPGARAPHCWVATAAEPAGRLPIHDVFGAGFVLLTHGGRGAVWARALDGAGIALRTIELHRPSLDDVFLTKTGRSLRES